MLGPARVAPPGRTLFYGAAIAGSVEGVPGEKNFGRMFVFIEYYVYSLASLGVLEKKHFFHHLACRLSRAIKTDKFLFRERETLQ